MMKNLFIDATRTDDHFSEYYTSSASRHLSQHYYTLCPIIIYEILLGHSTQLLLFSSFFPFVFPLSHQ
jgi:hypothetical protein